MDTALISKGTFIDAFSSKETFLAYKNTCTLRL